MCAGCSFAVERSPADVAVSAAQALIARPTMSITTRSSNPGDSVKTVGCGLRTERGRTSTGGLSAIRSLLVITAGSSPSWDARGVLRVVNRSRDQDMSVKGAPHGRAKPPSFLWLVNSVWATLRYSSSPVGGIEPGAERRELERASRRGLTVAVFVGTYAR